ncbi:MAG: type III pantothenate kinase [Melioribacteraceae bacterium]|nr:type III pantothenate kinase [Melioribacteraceae bacterium]MCF8353704.1 type III pantothenate kinase [Melioribacteraceae bacterium]MCF8394957.1 type III pantothenate kinase [Melioribacteraceae bacterium]MCF8418620.1 type III pantothenate kinase [Melioribacteraceae bacterium]
MILCLDVGNTQIYGGVFNANKLTLQFRKTSREQFSSDEIGIFLKSVLRENGVDPVSIKQVSICSVVPDKVHSLRNGCLKYFNIDPFILKPGVKTGLKIKYRNPLEVGTDRIANAIAATNLYPDKNLIVVDFGTATTFCVISKQKEYLGGIILPGIRISMETLEKSTSQLPVVEIKRVDEVVGRSTVESIQSGLYYGQIGMIKELEKRITDEAFNDEKPLIIGTGGFSRLFEDAGLFDVIIPTLVLQGLNLAINMNVKQVIEV